MDGNRYRKSERERKRELTITSMVPDSLVENIWPICYLVDKDTLSLGRQMFS